jgi:hypothetical protein
VNVSDLQDLMVLSVPSLYHSEGTLGMASIRPTKNGSLEPRILKTVEKALGDNLP